MTNLRAHSEDYGFALGAKAERFINPEQPLLINELWGRWETVHLLLLEHLRLNIITLTSP